MTEPPPSHRRDPFAGLYPKGVGRLRVAWRHLEIPGPPAAYRLSGAELTHPDPRARFARRAIQFIPCDGGDTLALVDKASPHGLFDLMLTEVSPTLKSTPRDVHPATGRTLWRSGYNFVRFCSDPDVADAFGLVGGELHLSLNCDPHTWDRESVQAAKQFHLHLLCWDRGSLEPLRKTEPLVQVRDPRLRRQALDPIAFLGARLVADALSGLDLGIPGAALWDPDEGAVLRGERPLGCVIALPGWAAITVPAFEDLVRRIHGRLDALAVELLRVFTGQDGPPPPWTRHPLLPAREIAHRLRAWPGSERARRGLTRLGGTLRGLSAATAARLARANPATRMDLMTLNQPAYALNLHAPHPLPPGCTLAQAPLVHLIIQPRLFSGIGGAGLLTLRGVPSVRVLRGRGTFSAEQWHHRAGFQRRFARYNLERLGADDPVTTLPVRRFLGLEQGWSD